MILNTENGKFYIGGSSKIDWRWKLHKNRLKSGQHNHLLQPDWDFYGPEAFDIFLIEETSMEELANREQFWLDITNSQYNVVTKALNNIGKGIKLSKDTKDKISLANTGREMSDEWKLNQSLRLKGKPLSEKNKLGISQALMGHQHTEDSKLKMSATRKGRPWTENQRRAREEKRMNNAIRV